MKIHCPICREPVETKPQAVGYVSFCACEEPGEIARIACDAIFFHVYERAFDAIFAHSEEA